MPQIETITATASYRDHCEDRVAVFAADERTVIIVADGAGGMGSGDVAAEFVVHEIEAHYLNIHSADQWCDLLRQIDCKIPSGESTAVVVDIRPYGIAGAGVGDSQAWMIRDDETIDLTKNQIRKPLLGSGHSSPVSFMNPQFDGILLVGTDGFYNYTKRDVVAPMVKRSDFYTIPRTCVEMVRLPSGELWDDIGIVVARIAPQHRTRKQYSI